MAYWLMKSEPDVYGIDHLQREGSTLWDGIRNYQARNFMRSMQIGDRAFFYHSNTKPPGIVGLMEVVETQIVRSRRKLAKAPLGLLPAALLTPLPAAAQPGCPTGKLQPRAAGGGEAGQPSFDPAG